MKPKGTKFSEEDILDVISKEIKLTSLRKTAARVGISAAYLSDIMRRNRGISENVANAFGFQQVIVVSVTFRKKCQNRRK